MSVEATALNVIVGWSGDNDERCIGICFDGIECCQQIELPICEKILELLVYDRYMTLVYCMHFNWIAIKRNYFHILSKQHGIGQAHIAHSYNSDYH